MLRFREYLSEDRDHHDLPNRINKDNFSDNDLRVIRNGITSYSHSREYNDYIRTHNAIPHEHINIRAKDVPRAFGHIFNIGKHVSLEHPAILYHGTRHEVKYHPVIVNGKKEYHTTIKTITSTTPNEKKAKEFLIKNEKNDVGYKQSAQHHLLAIHYHPTKHAHVPAVNVSEFSSKQKEYEVVLPPHTTYKHIGQEYLGIHPKSGKEIILHHVEPVHTHPQYDKNFKTQSEKEKEERLKSVR